MKMLGGTLPELTEEDIPGAELDESHAVHALRRWLLCHGIVAPTSWKRLNLLKGRCYVRLLVIQSVAVKYNMNVGPGKQKKRVQRWLILMVHIYKKQQKHLSEGMVIGRSTALPKPPLVGWESVNTANHKEMASKLPMVSLIAEVYNICGFTNNIHQVFCTLTLLKEWVILAEVEL